MVAIGVIGVTVGSLEFGVAKNFLIVSLGRAGGEIPPGEAPTAFAKLTTTFLARANCEYEWHQNTFNILLIP
jgi:hypothetical protein